MKKEREEIEENEKSGDTKSDIRCGEEGIVIIASLSDGIPEDASNVFGIIRK